MTDELNNEYTGPKCKECSSNTSGLLYIHAREGYLCPECINKMANAFYSLWNVSKASVLECAMTMNVKSLKPETRSLITVLGNMEKENGVFTHAVEELKCSG